MPTTTFGKTSSKYVFLKQCFLFALLKRTPKIMRNFQIFQHFKETCDSGICFDTTCSISAAGTAAN